MSDASPIDSALGGTYAVIREIGRGGMATVYLARDVKHDRDVALKVLRPEIGASLGVERFLAEIKLTAALQHPNILPLFDSGESAGHLWYAMPYVRGENLRVRLDREGHLRVDEAVAIARGIASALEHAHAAGIVHRDVKPENVLLSDGVPIVADFGIARAVKEAGATRVTAVGMSLGTPAYIAPEQAMGEEDVDRRADIYSLGCVIYEMLCGSIPFEGSTAQAIIAKHLTAPVPSSRNLRDTIPPTVDAAVQRAMAKERDLRWATAAELAQALVSTPAVEPMPDYSQVAEPVTRNTEPLAGRQKEFAQLLEKLAAAESGRGSLTLIGGEPGVGKTKLTETLLLEARRRGYLVLAGHCYEMEGTPPYLPFVEHLEYLQRTVPPGRLRAALGTGAGEIARVLPRLRQAFPDIPEPLDLPPDQQRHHLFTQFTEFFERAQRNLPLVLLFDDVHWGDESTLLLIEHLAAHVGRLRVLMLGTYRDVDLEVNRPFAKSLERLTRQRLAERIALRRMPESEVAEMLAQLGAPEPPEALVRAIFAETEGNPFFIEEVFRHLKEEGRLFDGSGHWRTDLALGDLEVPEGVKLVIGRRLERVGETCRSVLTAAAVIGPRFDLAVLEEVLEVDADTMLDALEEAERAGLVIAQQVKRETRYSFAHELIRQTLLGALSVPRRLRRHLKTAEAIESVYAGREASHASALAYHYFQAGSADEERTTRYLMLAGQQALGAGAFDEALGHAERAMSVLEESGDLRRAHVLWIRAAALRGLGRWEEAIGLFFEAAALFDVERDEVSLLRITCMLAEMLYFLAPEHERGLAAIERALERTADVPSLDRIQLLSLRGTLNGVLGRFREGLAFSDQAVVMAETMGSSEAVGLVLSERGALLTNAGHVQEAIAPLERAIALLQGTGKRWLVQWALSRYVNALRFIGRFDDVLAITEANESEARAIGHRGARLAFQVGRTMAAYALTGETSVWERAAAEAEEFTDLGTWGTIRNLYRSVLLYETDSPEAPHAMQGAAERFRHGTWVDVWTGEQFRATAAFDSTRARLLLDAWNPQIPKPGEPSTIGLYSVLPVLFEGLVNLGETARAASLRAACEQALAFGIRCQWINMYEVTARAAALAGDWADAERYMLEGLASATELRHVSAIADIKLRHGELLIARGTPDDRERARSMIDEALAMFERGGRLRRVREAKAALARL